MFFISDINGNLLPASEPTLENGVVRVARLDSRAEVPTVEETENETRQTERQLPASLQPQTDQARPADDAAAVFDGPVIEVDTLLENPTQSEARRLEVSRNEEDETDRQVRVRLQLERERINAANVEAAFLEAPVAGAATSVTSASNAANLASSQAVGLAAAGSSSHATASDDFDNESSALDRENERTQRLQPILPVGAVGTDPAPAHVVRASRSYRRAMPAHAPHTPAITAEQIMSSPVITLSENDTAAAARGVFHQHHFRHIPILSAQGKLIGILSDRDFIPPAQIAPNTSPEKVSYQEQSLREIMTTNILTALPQTEIRAIAKVLFENRIGSMPIVDESGKLLGLLTRSDILRTVVNHGPLELWT